LLIDFLGPGSRVSLPGLRLGSQALLLPLLALPFTLPLAGALGSFSLPIGV
jgi:hypothetical protein